MKKFKVTARATSYATLTVEAETEEQAIEIAEQTDGGDFTPCSDALGGWDIDPEAEEITEVPVIDLSEAEIKPVQLLDPDQPTTCPECGARTELVEETSEIAQLHCCLNPDCRYQFIGEFDYE